MKITDLYEYNMGIQGKDANAKSDVDEPEIDVPGEEIPDPKAQDNDVEKQLSQGSRKVGAMSGKKIQGGQFASGAGKVAQGKMPNKTELKQLAPIIGDVTNAMSDPKFAGRLGNLLKQANKEGVDESSLAKKILKKLTSKKPGKSIRKKSRLLQEVDENLFEINFNTKDIAKNALDLPIRCGFEAETVWDGISGGGSGQDIDDMSWEEVENELYISSRDSDYIDEGFSEYVRENLVPDYFDDVMARYLEDERDNDESYTRFMDDGSDAPTIDAVEEYRDNFKDEDPKEYENREEDGWEKINWIREYIDEEYEDSYLDFVREYLDDDGEVFQEAYDEAYNETSIDEWISNEFYSMSSFCDDYGIDYSELGSGDLDQVADNVYQYTKDTNFSGYPQTGEYAETDGDPGEWAVETDSSIESGSGTGAEIISPVYSTPREMLEDMNKFFNHIKSDVSTNSSTGLHVTMSWNAEAGGYEGSSSAEANKLKMATLLGDTYLLSTFGRENNSYTKQQSQNIKKKAADAVKAANKGSAGIGEVEDILGSGISPEKMNSINFKDIKDRETGTKLIEFRIGGGEDYHLDLPKIVKAVVRYATIMEAGYTKKYDKDYVNAMYKLVHNAGKIDSKDLERAKERFDLDHIKEPLVELFKTVLSKENYFDGVGQIANAYRMLRESEQVKEAVTKSPDELLKAQDYYVKAMAFLATDVATGKHRNRVSAQNIGVIRNSLKEFELSEKEFSDRIMRSLDNINIPTQNGQTKQKVGVIKKGVDTLFKKEILEKPFFLNIPKSELITKGTWNAIHSKNWSKADQEKLIDLLIKLTRGDNADKNSDIVSNMRYSIVNTLDNKEFNSFYTGMVRSSYNSNNPPAVPGEPYYEDAYIELIKFLKGFENYNEPVSRDHNANVSGGDSYIENFLSTYVMKLRKRFQHFSDLKDDDPQMYYDGIPELAKMTQDLIREIQPLEGGNNAWEETVGIDRDDLPANFEGKKLEAYEMLYDETDNHSFLAMGEYATEKLNNAIDRVAKKEYSDPFGGSVDFIIGERVTDSLRDNLGAYYKKKAIYPQLFELTDVKEVISKRFKAIKNWAKEFDALSQKIGFESQSSEIADKQVVDKREKQFKKNTQKDVLTLNIPAHSSAYMVKELFDQLTNNDYSKEARKNAQIQHQKQFTTKLNKHYLYVIPAAHWSQAHDAYEIQKYEGNHRPWRIKAAQIVMKQFYKTYGRSFSDILNGDYVSITGEEVSALKKQGIAVSREGDSREPNVQPLVPKEKTEQPGVGTPMSTSAAAAWHVNNPELSKKADALDKKATQDQNNTISTPPEKQFDSDYDKARANWGDFDEMMQSGMQNYLARGQVNDLVGFLNNPDNDQVFKSQVLGTIKNRNGNPFNSFRNALAATRRSNESVNESVPQTEFGMTDYQKIFSYIDANRSLGSMNLVLALMRKYDITKFQAREYMRNERTYGDANIDKHRSRINTTMENVFENFEELTLDQQLEIIRNDKISESLADITAARMRRQKAQQDYKQEMVTIWDNRPWPLPGSWDNKRLADAGFKRFSQGWKISKDKFDAIANPVRKSKIESLQVTEMLIKAKKLSENLPNNNKIDLINDILSKEFPAGDIDIQFKAFTALPIPRMMSDFSRLHSAQGSSADGRDILRHYAKSRMSDQDIKKLKLNENKDDLIAKIENMPDDETTRKLINYVEQLISDLGVGGRIQSLSKSLEDIPDEDVQKSIRQIAKIVASVDMTPEQRAKLFVDWKSDKLVNVDALLSPTTVTMNDIYTGYSEPHIKELVDDLQEVVQYGIGPGEFALAVLSQRISGMGASAGEDGGKGDLVVDGKPVELKTTRKNAARFNDRQVTTSNEYKSLVTQFFTKYAEKFAELESNGTKVKVGSGMQQAHVAAFLKAVPEAQDEIANIISNIFTNIPAVGGNITTMLKSGDINGAMQLIAQANVNNYLVKKRQSGNLSGILFIDLKKQTFNFIEDVKDLEGSGLRLHAKTNYLVTTNENPFANTSIVPTTRNVSEGKKNTQCPRTKAPVCYCGNVNKLTEAEETVYAYCEFEHGEITGAVNLEQASGQATKISGKVEGLEPGEHGFHIHEFGDLSDGCDSAGGHYNPDNVDHGDLDNGHVGDLGNITADKNGIAQFSLVAERVELSGDRSVVGRAIVVHKDEDDLGKGGDDESLKTGNAGERAGCGVIRLKNMNENDNNGTGSAKDLSTMAGGLYKRQQMPQLKPKHLADKNITDQYDIETRQGIIGINKLKPAQIDGRQDYISNISKEIVQFIKKNPKSKIKDYLAGRPFIVDVNGFIVNGHHRYWAIRSVTDKQGGTNVTRIPVIFVNKTIHELVDLFGPGGTAIDLTSKKKGLSIVKPDVQDPQTLKYQQELDLRMNRSKSAKQGWATRRKGDPRQTSFNFNKETEKEE